MPAAAAIPAETLQARKQQLVRSAIWDAATDLFWEKGFDETTVDDIAHRAGISRRTFFRYFASKNDVLGEGIATYRDHMRQVIASCPLGESIADAFRHVILTVAKDCAPSVRTRKVMEIADRYPAAKEALLSRSAELQPVIEEAWSRRMGGRLRSEMLGAMLAEMTVSVMAVIFRKWFERGNEEITAIAKQALAAVGRIGA
jgi:AcrR family transcriptional regulator